MSEPSFPPPPPADLPPPGVPPAGWPPQAQPGQAPAYYVAAPQPQQVAVPPGWVLIPAQAAGQAAQPVAPPPAAAAVATGPLRRAAVPGEVAQWDARAYSSLVDIAVAAGIITAWQMTLVVLAPLLQLVAWLAGGNWNTFVDWSTYILFGSWWAWQWLERGITGQSLGQRLIGVAVVDEETRRPIGPVRSLMRSLTHVVDVLPLWAGLARPAWDPKKQTWADKIHHTIAITVERPAQVPGRGER
jgi:uncharacterized RDD family membrane protein YckC